MKIFGIVYMAFFHLHSNIERQSLLTWSLFDKFIEQECSLKVLNQTFGWRTMNGIVHILSHAKAL